MVFFQISVVGCGGGGRGGCRVSKEEQVVLVFTNTPSHRHMRYCCYYYASFFFVAPEKMMQQFFSVHHYNRWWSSQPSRWNSFDGRRVGLQSDNLMYYIMVGRYDYEHFKSGIVMVYAMRRGNGTELRTINIRHKHRRCRLVHVCASDTWFLSRWNGQKDGRNSLGIWKRPHLDPMKNRCWARKFWNWWLRCEL